MLKPRGLAIFSVPLFENGREMFEPPAGMSKREIQRICGWDHKRIYGFDFLDRLREAGFETAEITCTPEDAARYRMTHDKVGHISGHRVFVAWKTTAIAASDEVPAARAKASLASRRLAARGAARGSALARRPPRGAPAAVSSF